MHFLCNNCSINCSIEKHRDKLDKIISEKNHNLLDEEVIKSSQFLDNLVYKCTFCNRNMNCLSKLNERNISETNKELYYYGDEHLFNIIYLYIQEGIKNNELIHISMEENLYGKLLDFLRLNKVPIKHVKFKAEKKLMTDKIQSGLNELKERVNSILSHKNHDKYTRSRLNSETRYVIQSTSQKDFLDVEVKINELIKNKKSPLICLCDAYNYMSENKSII